MDDPDDKPHLTIASRDEMVKQLTDLKEKFARGDIRCAALRVYKADGSWEDVVLGGDSEDERARALEDLHREFRAAH